MKKVLITGTNGFIGGSLAKELIKRKVTVYGVDCGLPAATELQNSPYFQPVIADFTKYKDLASLITDRDIEVFYHFAWAGGFTTAIKDYHLQMQNAAFAGDALKAAVDLKISKFVYAGTYNQYEIENFLESSGFSPRYTCIYSTGKTAAGLICRTLAYNLGISYTAGLIPMPYGENNYSKQLVNMVLDSLNHGIAPKLVQGNNLYDLVYIRDIVEAFILLGEKGKNDHEYYIGHRKLKTFRELMNEIKDIIAPGIELRFGEYQDNQQIDYSKINLNALYEDTGFECKADFAESIRNTAEWVKNHL